MSHKPITLETIAITCGVVAVAGVIFVGSKWMLTEPSPKPIYTVVKTCKPPFMRNASSFLVRDETGKLYYQNGKDGLLPVNDEASIRDVCK